MTSLFVGAIEAEDWEYDEETGGLVHLLRADERVQAGLWRPGPVAGRAIELTLDADETILVLEGTGRLEVDGEPPVELRAGVTVSMRRGARTTWIVDESFREFWVYSLSNAT